MILTDSLTQPLALAIYALLGLIMGVLYTLNYVACAFILKGKLYRHLSQSLFVILYGLAFFCVTLMRFDYDLKIYHLLISIITTTITSTLLYLPIRSHHSLITAKFDAVKGKLSQSKLVKRIKK